MFEERRADPRERLAIALLLGDGLEGVTRDVSAAGLYFELDGDQAVARSLDVTLHVPELGMQFTARAEVLRVEHAEGHTGVAVQLHELKLVHVDEQEEGAAYDSTPSAWKH